MSDRASVFTEVQATLLNSEDEPRSETVEALRAIVRFAREELGFDDNDIRSLLDEATQEEDSIEGNVT